MMAVQTEPGTLAERNLGTASARSRRIARAMLLAGLIVCILPTLASAKRDRDRDGDSEDAAWMPSFSISFGVHNQSISGDTTSTASSFAREDGDSLITEFFQFGGKLHTPLEFDIPTRPRLFLSAGVQIPLASELIGERIDTTYDRFPPGGLTEDPEFLANCPNNIPVSLPRPNPDPNPNGQTDSCGLRIRNQVTIEAMWYAGFGVDFTVPIFEDQFHILPAVEYYGLAIESVGDFQRSSSGDTLDDIVEQANSVGNAEVFHGISRALSFSADVYENGPWRWSMVLQGRVVFLLNEPNVSSSSSLGLDTITFNAGIDDFIVQGSGGFQVQWTGRK